ncbi:MAG TPA: Gfo/Idh/MocA family oxidoreductase [Bacillota bacterium]|nr:Gfo/Idh/MocA family oxidoreductase [Bacillota bacterium]
MNQPPIRWGILGTGSIARSFTQDLKLHPSAQVVAVGSRAPETATRFAQEFNIPHAYGSYEELAYAPGVDVIYVCTPHAFHRENAELCLLGGKAVLCEKAFTINSNEAAEVIAIARKSKLYLMEAMWTRFLPVIIKVREWLGQGKIGAIRMLKSDFGFRAAWEPEKRWLNPALGGGALLDVGVYPVSLASMIFGEAPIHIKSLAHLGATGVDEQNALIFEYQTGALALLSSAVQTNTQKDTYIYGTAGYIHIPGTWWAKSAFLWQNETLVETCQAPYTGNGYYHEAAAVMADLRSGKLENDLIPLDETLAVIKTLDEIRAQWGFRYPTE